MTTNIVRGAEIWAAIMRITPLDPYGNIIAGSSVWVTDYQVKATPAAVMETGDEIAVKNAAGRLPAWGKKDDIPKWSTLALELAIPDPSLIAALCGGTVFESTAEGLGALGSAPTVVDLAGGGSLPNLLAAFAVTQGNAFGQTTISAETSLTPSANSRAMIELVGAAAGADYFGVYGRAPGAMGLLAIVKNFGTQAISSNLTAGSPTTIPVTALTKPIPEGAQFIISGDTNSPQIVFTATQTAGVDAEEVMVSVSAAIVTTIDAADLVQVYIDNGVAPVGKVPPSSDLSAGPGGNIGYQASPQGSVGNSNGVSIEIWTEHVIDGEQDVERPWVWSVFPRVTGLHTTTRDFTNANLGTMIEGVVRENANWGSGPNNDFPVDATRSFQDTVCGDEVVPVPGVNPVGALA